jgi:nicotinamidase-related amidase
LVYGKEGNMNETLAKTALLIIDVQSELFQKSTPIYRAKVLLENIQALTERAHQAGVPVIYIQHSSNAFLIKGSEGWQIHPQLKPLEGEKIIHKCHPSAFKETELKEHLDTKGIQMLVIAGLVTHGCVKATSLDALKHGYQVVLVSDAHSSYSKDAAKLITEWNAKIGKAGAVLQETEAVAF